MLTSTRRLVVKEHAVGCKHIVCLAVIINNPVRIKLGDTIRRARIEWRGFLLRDLLNLSVEFGRGCLVGDFYD